MELQTWEDLDMDVYMASQGTHVGRSCGLQSPEQLLHHTDVIQRCSWFDQKGETPADSGDIFPHRIVTPALLGSRIMHLGCRIAQLSTLHVSDIPKPASSMRYV